MNIYIVIPAHNEANYIALMLDALAGQTVLPKQVVVVNDNSTDATQDIIDSYVAKNEWLKSITIASSDNHMPGSKVVKAFYKGFETLDDNYDIICKFDADIILPKNYLETLISMFKSDTSIGIAGGLAYIEHNGKWVYESVASKQHVRGPFKAYTKSCFENIGGLKPSIGWDTVDVLLAKFHGFKVKTDHSLQVKHLKPTGKTYNKTSQYLQGEAFYKMRYGFVISLIAALKKGVTSRNIITTINDIKGYFKAKRNKVTPIVSEVEGKFIRQLRWKGVFGRLK